MEDNLSKQDLEQILTDLKSLFSRLRNDPSYISHGLNHILNKKELFSQYPLFGWQITPNPRTNTRGPSMRFFTGKEGDNSLDSHLFSGIRYLKVPNLIKEDGLFMRAYIFLEPGLNKTTIEEWGNSLWHFAWESPQRYSFKDEVVNAYHKSLLLCLQRNIDSIDGALNPKSNQLF